jgi:hypothetical protein
MTLKMTFDQVNALDGRSYSPPVDSLGAEITGFSQWTQTVDVQPVDPDRLTSDIVEEDPSAVRVTVTVSRTNENQCSMIWYRFKPMP